MSRYGGLDYPQLTKGGFLSGMALFVFGGASEIVGRTLAGSLPGWEDTLFVGMIVLGLVVGFVSVFVFGIALPLTE